MGMVWYIMYAWCIKIVHVCHDDGMLWPLLRVHDISHILPHVAVDSTCSQNLYTLSHKK